MNVPVWKPGVTAGCVVLCQALGVSVVGYSPVLSGVMLPSLRCTSFTRKPEQIQVSQGAAVPLSPEDTQRKKLSPVWNYDQSSRTPVLWSSVVLDSFIYSFPCQILYLLRSAMCQVLSYLQYSDNQDRHSPCQFNSRGRKGSWLQWWGMDSRVRPPLGLPHSQQPWVSS